MAARLGTRAPIAFPGSMPFSCPLPCSFCRFLLVLALDGGGDIDARRDVGGVVSPVNVSCSKDRVSGSSDPGEEDGGMVVHGLEETVVVDQFVEWEEVGRRLIIAR